MTTDWDTVWMSVALLILPTGLGLLSIRLRRKSGFLIVSRWTKLRITVGILFVLVGSFGFYKWVLDPAGFEARNQKLVECISQEVGEPVTVFFDKRTCEAGTYGSCVTWRTPFMTQSGKNGVAHQSYSACPIDK